MNKLWTNYEQTVNKGRAGIRMIDGLKRFNVRISPNNGRYKMGKRPFRLSSENGPRSKNPRIKNSFQKPTNLISKWWKFDRNVNLCYNIIKEGPQRTLHILKKEIINVLRIRQYTSNVFFTL